MLFNSNLKGKDNHIFSYHFGWTINQWIKSDHDFLPIAHVDRLTWQCLCSINSSYPVAHPISVGTLRWYEISPRNVLSFFSPERFDAGLAECCVRELQRAGGERPVGGSNRHVDVELDGQDLLPESGHILRRPRHLYPFPAPLFPARSRHRPRKLIWNFIIWYIYIFPFTYIHICYRL